MASPQVQQVVYPQMSRRPPFNVQVPGVEKKPGEGIPRRHPACVDGLQSRLEPDIRTTYDIVRRGAARFGDAKCLGSRTLIKQHHEQKMLKKMVDGVEQEVPKTWTYYEMSGYRFLNFKEYYARVNSIGSGLKNLGLQKQDKVHIFAATSANWLAVSHGCASQSLPIVTAYDTLGKVGLTHSLVQTEARAIFLDSHLLPNLTEPLKEASNIAYIIYNTDQEVNQSHIDKLQEIRPLQILSIDDLVKLGEENPVGPDPSGPEDLCGIMYTSGSTGAPKGVPLLQKNVMAAVTGVTFITRPYIGPGDHLLTFLPLAHILELVFENACLFWGSTMGYGSPKTLSNRSMRNCKGDMLEFRPTILVGVPAIWETVKKGVMDQVAKQPAFNQKLFWGALALKSFLLQAGLPGTRVLNSVVFGKVKAATGGRLKLCMNGGGPVAKETQHFISMVICPMIIGYGLTETSAMGALMEPSEWNCNSLGTIPASIEVKLVDFPDAGYFSDNIPEQGEIWIRGDSVASAYFQNDEETKEAFEGGWFKTGDIGEWDSNGHLRIIDRKKNLVKTSNGEYIALEKLESVYRACALVANICVYADQNKTKPIALIVPLEPALKKLASSIGVNGELEELVHNEKVNKAVLKELVAAGRSGGLAGIELIEGVVLTDEEWTPQNSLVTSAQKLNRRGILEKYKKEVDRAYGVK